MPLLENYGVVWVPVEPTMNYGANNPSGQVRQLKFEQILEGVGVVYTSASRVEDKKYLNFGVDV